jgi:hypothetical protein
MRGLTVFVFCCLSALSGGKERDATWLLGLFGSWISLSMREKRGEREKREKEKTYWHHGEVASW